MNRIILEESECIRDSLYCLDHRKSNHIIKILNSKIGDRLKAGILNQSIGTGIVHMIDLNKREVFIDYKEENANLPDPILSGVRVFSSIQRPQTVKKIIQLCANCGVSELFFFPAEKSEFTYLNSSIWSERSILDEVILGLEQGGRVISPEINVLKNKYRIKEHLTTGSRFILDFGGKSLFDFEISFNTMNPIQIVFGPESGFTDEDINFFLNLNFEKISVSENILRSEIALSFALAQVELLKSLATREHD